MPKISRVIYNRLDGPGDKEGTGGLLQIDATVNYALGKPGPAAKPMVEALPANTVVIEDTGVVEFPDQPQDALKGFDRAGPSKLYRKFVDTPGVIEITANGSSSA